MKILKDWTVSQRLPNGVDLLVDGRHHLRIRVLEHDLFRVSLLKGGQWRLPRSWTVAPGGDAPIEGRSRDDDSGFSCPAITIDEDRALVLQSETIRLTIGRPLHFRWDAHVADAWVPFAQERPTGGVMLDVEDHHHAHFLSRHPDEAVHGLGEKTGDLNRAGRRFEMRNLDAMGYDAQSTDPLYKHVPFTMTQTAKAGVWSIFYDNLAPSWFDLGNELDNYHTPYRSYRAQDGDLDYYLAWAPRMLDLVKRHVRLTGGTAFPPRWTLGYSGSTMSYTDRPDAQAQLESFLDRIAEHDIACDSFQMSSGYTSIGAKRYVFNWNREKVPDVDAMTAKFRDADIHLVANIKPCLLKDHPRYDEAAAAGLFIRDSEQPDRPEISTFWDDEGSHLDFTNPDAIAWWQDGVTRQLLDHGIDSTWNDNNEYEIWDRRARCDGFGEGIDIELMRPVMPILMSRASEDAQRRHAPDLRPYLISRSGAPGLQRHAQTWSGDNRTDWKTLRYNIRTGLGMSLSGFYNIGHDVGGFAGRKPEPELFVRWVQNGIFHPRFTIHSWNDDGTANEPWMYPDVLPHIRDAIDLRYRLMPYLYTCLWRAVTEDEPMLRPVFLDHPDDRDAWAECDEFLLGRDLLVASVVDEGASERTVRLPRNETGWTDFHTGQTYEPGERVTLDVDLASIPLFVRRGAVLPLATGARRAMPEAETGRTLHLFPAAAGGGESLLYDDDGVSADPDFSLLRFTLTAHSDRLDLSWMKKGSHPLLHSKVAVGLPKGEGRSLRVDGREAIDGQEIEL